MYTKEEIMKRKEMERDRNRYQMSNFDRSKSTTVSSRTGRAWTVKELEEAWKLIPNETNREALFIFDVTSYLSPKGLPREAYTRNFSGYEREKRLRSLRVLRKAGALSLDEKSIHYTITDYGRAVFRDFCLVDENEVRGWAEELRAKLKSKGVHLS